jgi:RNA polymerase sigma factor (TIGR02999 family)
MRRILVDNVRRKRSLKRGGQRSRQDLDEVQPAAPEPHEDLLALDQALNKLATKDSLKAQLVQLRYFAGLTVEEAARTLGISCKTAERYWTYAKAWLHREIGGGI